MPTSRLEGMNDEEVRVRVELAAAYRLVAMFGWDDLIFTHLSVRVPGTPHFLINPFGLLFEEITASSLVKIDVDGNKVENNEHSVNRAGFVIHSAIHQAREDAHAVIHLHTVDGQAVSAQKHGLLPLTQTAMTVCQQLGSHDYEGIAVDTAERERLVRDLGDHLGLLLRNHGTLTIGATIPEAFLRMYFVERACSAQVRALAGDAPLNSASDASIHQAAAMGRGGLGQVAEGLVWPALVRKLDRLDTSYRS